MMEIVDIKKKIAQLQEEIQAMKNVPALQKNYKEKIQKLMKLRRSLIRKGKKACL
jgi:hypothetical protein